MRRNHISAPRLGAQSLSALALLACLAGPMGGLAPTQTLADEAAPEQDGAAQADQGAAAGEDGQPAQDGAAPSDQVGASTDAGITAPQPLSVKSLSTDAVAADPALQDLAAQNTLAVDVSLTNDTDQAQAFYDALNEARAQAGGAAAARDAELEAAAWQRAAEAVLAPSGIRPDGTAFTTACARSAAEVIVWGTSADNTAAADVLAALRDDATYADQYGWLLSATNLGCACVSDKSGNVYWAIEVGYDGAGESQAEVASGEVTYVVAAAAANVAGIELPERLEMKSGQTAQASLPATVQGTLWFGAAGYSYDFTGAQVVVEPSNFIWNSANAQIVSVTADGTLTAHKAGTVTISSTDADGSNPRFGGVVVDGGSDSAKYDLAACTLVGLTGSDGRGNYYLNAQGSVDVPAFNVMAPDGTVIDPVNYTASISYNATTSIAVLSVKANSKSDLCSGIATKQLAVVDPNAQVDDTAAVDEVGTDAAEGGQAGGDSAGQDGGDAAGAADAQDDAGTQAGAGGAADTDGTDTQPDATQEADAEPADGDGMAPADGAAQGDGQDAPAEPQDNAGDGSADGSEAQDAQGDIGSATDGEVQDVQGDGKVTQPEEGAQGPSTPETVQTAKSIAQGQLTLSFASLTYTGSPLTATSSSLTVDGTTLVEGTDYTLNYADNTEVGTASAQATGIGAYTGTLKTTFDISPADISQASVTMPNLAYTGQAMQPQPLSVTYTTDAGARELTLGVDYQVVGFTGNLNVGTASTVLQGMGNYTGTLIAEWKIVPQGTAEVGTTQTVPQTGDATDPTAGAALAGLGAALVLGAGALVLLARRNRTASER